MAPHGNIKNKIIKKSDIHLSHIHYTRVYTVRVYIHEWLVFVCAQSLINAVPNYTAWTGNTWINSIRWFILWNESGNLWPSVDKWKRRTCDLWHKRGNYPGLLNSITSPHHPLQLLPNTQHQPAQLLLHKLTWTPFNKHTQTHAIVMSVTTPNHCTDHVLSFSVISRHFSQKLCDYSFITWPDAAP